MKRGEIWTVSGGSAYTSKPRPALIIQDDHFVHLDSIVVCPLTSDATEAMHFRPVLMPNDLNGLARPSRVMVDKVGAIPKAYLGKVIGSIELRDLARIDRAMIVFLGIAGSTLKPANDE
jgi:mRNA interferase MazF